KEENKFVKSISETYQRIIDAVKESWGTETLKEDYESTGARNESSAVLYADIDGYKVLLTGDAGKQALHNSADYAENILGIKLSECTFVQMPHHGSRRNVSPSVLNRILGEVTVENAPTSKITFV